MADPDGVRQAQLDAYDDQQVTITPVGVGYRLSGYLTAETAAALSTALDAVVDGWYRTGSLAPEDQPGGHPALDAQRRKARRPHLLALALGHLATARSTPALLGTRHGVRPHLTLTADLDQLLTGLGGRLHVPGHEQPVLLPDESLRRILCDTDLHPVITTRPTRAPTSPATAGSSGPAWRDVLTDRLPAQARTVLYLGRTQRTVPPRLRRALEVRDGHCAFPDCRVDVSRTHAHHTLPWEDGGATDHLEHRAPLRAPPPRGARGRLVDRADRRHRPAHHRLLDLHPTTNPALTSRAHHHFDRCTDDAGRAAVGNPSLGFRASEVWCGAKLDCVQQACRSPSRVPSRGTASGHVDVGEMQVKWFIGAPSMRLSSIVLAFAVTTMGVGLGTATTASADVTVQLLSSTMWSDTLGYQHIVGEVRNNTTSPVYLVQVNIDLLDTSSGLVGTDSTFTAIDDLAPGESSPFVDIISSPPPGFAAYRITSVAGAVTTTATVNHNFTTAVTNRYADSAGYEHFVGTVTNNNRTTSVFVEPVFAFRDAGGQVVDTDFTFVKTDSSSSLAPGQTASFEEIRRGDVAYTSYEVLSQSSSPSWVDTTPPSASPTPSVAANSVGWNNAAVAVTWNWTDSDSGIDPNNCTTSTASVGLGRAQPLRYLHGYGREHRVGLLSGHGRHHASHCRDDRAFGGFRRHAAAGRGLDRIRHRERRCVVRRALGSHAGGWRHDVALDDPVELDGTDDAQCCHDRRTGLSVLLCRPGQGPCRERQRMVASKVHRGLT